MSSSQRRNVLHGNWTLRTFLTASLPSIWLCKSSKISCYKKITGKCFGESTISVNKQDCEKKKISKLCIANSYTSLIHQILKDVVNGLGSKTCGAMLWAMVGRFGLAAFRDQTKIPPYREGFPYWEEQPRRVNQLKNNHYFTGSIGSTNWNLLQLS